jgi:hypothetical protein
LETRHHPQPIHHTHTARLRSGLQESEILCKVKKVLCCFQEEGLNLAIFLDALSWGSKACISDNQVRYELTILLSSKELPLILQRWWQPPDGRAEAAHNVIKDFALEVVGSLINNEMKNNAPCMTFDPPPLDLSLEALTSIDLEALASFLESDAGAPNLWNILQQAGWSPKQAARNKHKTPKNVCQF